MEAIVISDSDEEEDAEMREALRLSLQETKEPEFLSRGTKKRRRGEDETRDKLQSEVDEVIWSGSSSGETFFLNTLPGIHSENTLSFQQLIQPTKDLKAVATIGFLCSSHQCSRFYAVHLLWILSGL